MPVLHVGFHLRAVDKTVVLVLFVVLLRGDVFSADMLNTWMEYKYEREIIPMQQRPAPYEFYLYYDL